MKNAPLTCSRCPKWAACWCPIKAAPMVPAHPMCDFGRRAYTRDYAAKWMRKKHGYTKRKEKLPGECQDEVAAAPRKRPEVGASESCAPRRRAAATFDNERYE